MAAIGAIDLAHQIGWDARPAVHARRVLLRPRDPGPRAPVPRVSERTPLVSVRAATRDLRVCGLVRLLARRPVSSGIRARTTSARLPAQPPPGRREPHGRGAIGAVATAVVVVVLATTSVLVVRRVRHARGPTRRALAPVLVVAAAMIPAFCALLVFEVIGATSAAGIAGDVQSGCSFMLIPVAFLVGLLRMRMHRSRVAELVVALGSASQPAEVRDAIARTLRDPSLVLAFWLPDSGRYVDPDGRGLSVADGARPRGDGARARAATGSPRSSTIRRCSTTPSSSRRSAPPPRSRSRTRACRPSCAPSSPRSAPPARAHRRGRRRRAAPARARPPRRRPAAPARDPARAPARPRPARRRRRRPRPTPRRRRHRGRRRARRAARARPRHPPRDPHRRRPPRRARRARPARTGPGRADRRHRPPLGARRGDRLLRHRRSARQHRQARARLPRDRRRRARERQAHRRDHRRRHRRRRRERPGLRGLRDRVEALDGNLRIESPAGHGTHLAATIPCALAADPP